jgi:hypothetical protein
MQAAATMAGPLAFLAFAAVFLVFYGIAAAIQPKYPDLDIQTIVSYEFGIVTGIGMLIILMTLM